MIQSVLFGIIQGLTEFLPVSSSGHLVIFKHLVPGMEKWADSVDFEVAVHIGTTLSILVLLWRDVVDLLQDGAAIVRAWLQRLRSGGIQSAMQEFERHVRASPKIGAIVIPMALAIVVGSLPTAIIALLIRNQVEQMFSSMAIVGVTLAITGTVLWITRWFGSGSPPPPASQTPNGRPRLELRLLPAVVVGIVQGLAVMPGISRSGSTISAGLIMGLNREVAGKFSFLLSVPAILGAGALKCWHFLTLDPTRLHELFVGGFVSFVVGYVCLRVLMPVIKRGRFYFFAYYCWFAAAVALVLSCR